VQVAAQDARDRLAELRAIGQLLAEEVASLEHDDTSNVLAGGVACLEIPEEQAITLGLRCLDRLLQLVWRERV
jgi:hypothetical protein